MLELRIGATVCYVDSECGYSPYDQFHQPEVTINLSGKALIF